MFKMDGKEFVRRVDFLLAVQNPSKNKGEFYEKSGISSASMSQYRTGSFNVSIKQIEKAASYFGITVDEFVAEKESNAEVKNENMSEIKKSAIDMIADMDDDQVKKLIIIIQALK